MLAVNSIEFQSEGKKLLPCRLAALRIDHEITSRADTQWKIFVSHPRKDRGKEDGR